MVKAQRRMLKARPKYSLSNRKPARVPLRARIKGAIAPTGKELKYVDTVISQKADSTGALTPLNLIAVGDDNTTRDGRQVTIKSVQLKLNATEEVSTTVPQICRAMVVWDNAVNGVGPNISDIISPQNSAGFAVVNNQQRFTVLMDRRFDHRGMHEAAYVLDFYKKLNHITQFNGTTAAIGSIQNGALYLLTIGDQIDATTVAGSVRVRFCDQ